MNWVVVAGLGGLGFAFPPIWIALGLYLVWALFLKRGLRASVIKKDLSDLHSSGRLSGYIGVHYIDAEKYALQYGGRKNNTGSEMPLLVNGINKRVTFSQPNDDNKKYMTFASINDN